MATVTGLTAPRMLAIEAASVVSGVIDVSGHLILTKHDGTTIDAGSVLGSVPDATDTVKGIVELATEAETTARLDSTRAITPAGFAATYNDLDGRIDTLEISPGTKVEVIVAPLESADPTSYPTGISLVELTAGSGWSLNGGLGLVVTINHSSNRCQQTFYTNTGGTQNPTSWIRTHHSTNGGGGWTAWNQIHSGLAISLLGIVYPVGSVYISAISTNPATLFGMGTWAALPGRFLIGADGTYPAGVTGGAATATLTTANVPSHTHSFSATSSTDGSHTHALGEDQDGATGTAEWINHSTGVSGAERSFVGAMSTDGSHSHTVSGTSGTGSGSGTAFSILPPYLPVYMWQRTA